MVLTKDRTATFHSRYFRSAVVSCWNWTGRLGRTGYGEFDVGRTSMRVHRLSWIIFRGKIPKGKCVLHKCDNRRCVNPDHLFIGTQADNVHDMVQKGRDRPCRLEKNGRAILNRQKVKLIRVLNAMGISNKEIGRKLGISTNRAWAISSRRQWVGA